MIPIARTNHTRRRRKNTRSIRKRSLLKKIVVQTQILIQTPRIQVATRRNTRRNQRSQRVEINKQRRKRSQNTNDIVRCLYCLKIGF